MKNPVMGKLIFIIPLVLIVLISGCIQDSGVRERPTWWIYKTKADYTNQMSAVLDLNNSIGLHPALPHPSAVKSYEGYYYARGPKSNILNYIVIIDMTLDEWDSWKGAHNADELKDYILEMHPFEEAYFCDGSEEDIKQNIPSLSIGEIPTECEQITFSPRPGEPE